MVGTACAAFSGLVLSLKKAVIFWLFFGLLIFMAADFPGLGAPSGCLHGATKLRQAAGQEFETGSTSIRTPQAEFHFQNPHPLIYNLCGVISRHHGNMLSLSHSAVHRLADEQFCSSCVPPVSLHGRAGGGRPGGTGRPRGQHPVRTACAAAPSAGLAAERRGGCDQGECHAGLRSMD